MTDSCIITKFDISEREKAIKKAFFKGKKEKIVPEASRQICEDEVINKMIDDNFKNKPVIQQTAASPLPINLIYSQNKILERNVDVLQEQQRSIHDLLVYNLQHNRDKRETGLKAEIIDENKKLMKEIIGPLYSNIEGLKASMEKLAIDTRQVKQQDDYLKKVNEASSLNYKVRDMMEKHQEFKEQSNIVERKLERNIKPNDTVILKAIEEVKNSISQINNEMNKMEENFSTNFKSVLMENEKKNLMGRFHSSTSLPQQSKLDIARQEKKIVDLFNYKEIKDDMLDINLRKDEILNEFMTNKIKIPKIKPPKGKINFSFSLDDEDTDVSKRSIKKTKPRNKSSNNNKTKDAEEVFTPSSSNIYTKKEKNVFLNNMEQDEFFRERRHQQETHKDNTMELRAEKRATSISPQERKTEYEDTNVAESMKKVADKLRKNKLTSPTSNSMNMSTEPSSAKYRKTIGLIKGPLPVIKEDNFVEEKPKQRDLGVSGINKAEKEVKPIEINRKGITQVETTFKEKKDRNILEEVVTRLCVEKLMEKNKPKIVGEIVDNPMPFKFKGNQLTAITENLMKDYIRNMLKNKKPVDQNIPVNESRHISVRESNPKVIIQNTVPDMSLLNEINARLSELKNVDESELVDKIVRQLQNKMTININLNQDKKPEYQPVLQSVHNDEIEIEGNKDEAKEVNKSDYTNPFEDKGPIDYDKANIPYPYLFNIGEYDLSESSSYITDTARVSVREPIVDESSSDYNSSYSYTRSVPKTEQTPSRSEFTEESSTISININKRLIDLNNNEYLKTLNLYDSDEHRMFQRNFGQRVGGFESDRSETNPIINQQNQHFTQMTQRLDSGRSNNVMFSFGNDRSYVEKFRNDMSERLGIDLVYSGKGLHINNTISEDSESNVSNTISVQPQKVYRTDESSSIYTNNE